MTPPAVLAIGLDPAFADFSDMPQLTPALVRAYVEAEIASVRQSGFDVDLHLVAPGEAAESEIEAALRARDYACVVIGAGLREPVDQLSLFEKLLNLVHRLAPQARIAFNSAPNDTADAIERWVALPGGDF